MELTTLAAQQVLDPCHLGRLRYPDPIDADAEQEFGQGRGMVTIAMTQDEIVDVRGPSLAQLTEECSRGPPTFSQIPAVEDEDTIPIMNE
jgi:hypothetical protein